MAELSPQERLQPSLLDRLTDEEPHRNVESRERRFLTIRKLRESVLRDIAWLLNTGNLDTVDDLEEFPHVQESVINYGIPDLAGNTASTVDAGAIERILRRALLRFEPRILKNTLAVHVIVSGKHMNRNALSIEIEGDLWARPLPERLYLKTEIDLETGAVTMDDRGGPGR